MPELLIYHNPRCSKSRAALALLRARGLSPTVVDYLHSPPDAATLVRLLAALGLPAAALVRRGEAVFKQKYAGREIDEAAWLAALQADPILIERPIVVLGTRAVIGRPPERVAELFD